MDTPNGNFNGSFNVFYNFGQKNTILTSIQKKEKRKIVIIGTVETNINFNRNMSEKYFWYINPQTC